MDNEHRIGEVADALARLIEGDSSAVVRDVLNPVANFWDVIDYGDAAGEIRYSKMIGWLLDPQGSHGLGPSFAQSFVNAAFDPEVVPVISPRARVHPREWRNIDILLVDHDEQGQPLLTLVIENKTDTIEHARSGLDVKQTRWYNWVIRGDFGSIHTAIDASSLDSEEKSRLHKRAHGWEAEAGHYRNVPESGRYFVYLTPRTGDTAEDPDFQTLSYERLEELLADAEGALSARDSSDAEKIVRDFRRAIHRRYHVKLDQDIHGLFEGEDPADSPTGGESSLAPELTGLANALGCIDEEHRRPGDDQYLETARTDPVDVITTLGALNDLLTGRALSQAEFSRLIEYVWDHRPQRGLNDTSRFFWGNDRARKLTKIELLQKIALAFAQEHDATTVSDFSREFGAVIARVVGTPRGNSFTGADIIIDPDFYAYSPAAATRYRAREVALRDEMGPLLLDDGRYRVSWQLGYRSAAQAGRNIHLPLIRHFVALGYPISEAS